MKLQDQVRITKIIIYIYLIKQSSELLEGVISKTEKINDFDYKRMIKDFETNARHEEHLKRIKKKRAAEMKKYEETIQHMKELREETYQRKNNELKKKLKNKEQLLITSLENKQKEQMKEKERAIAEMVEKENQARKKVELNMLEQEKERLQFEKDIHDKSKILIT